MHLVLLLLLTELEEDQEDEPEEEYDQEDEDTVDLRAYQVLGGVSHLDLLSLPPQPKQVKSWIMTQGMYSSKLYNVY